MMNEFRQLPSVEKLIQNPELSALIEDYGRNHLITAIRDSLSYFRLQIKNEQPVPSTQQIISYGIKLLTDL